MMSQPRSLLDMNWRQQVHFSAATRKASTWTMS
jgi:hypothetical protein